MDNTPAEHELINKLQNDGMVVIQSAIYSNELDRLRTIYDTIWNEIQSHLDALEWKQIKFNNSVQMKTGFIGKVIYNDKRIADYDGDQLIDMGNSRYDFTRGFENIKLASPIISNVMENLLKFEFDSYLGALPIRNTKNNSCCNGIWHRDAYSLFDNETIDMVLPPFYYTVLIALDKIDIDSGRSTEFILGTHKLNLAEHNIHNTEDFNKFYKQCTDNEIPEYASYKLECEPGDICIFHGYLIHRGIGNCNNYVNQLTANTRICYAVYKKNWYNDEPEANYYLE
jgi:ectoine hydroxylase-related dioxygenase (phytanoyl-CoA dioxygenase family)